LPGLIPAVKEKQQKYSNAKLKSWLDLSAFQNLFFSAVPSEGRNKLGCYYKYDRLKVSDSDDGHGKEEHDAEMENTEG
jgi:hypothetical protein